MSIPPIVVGVTYSPPYWLFRFTDEVFNLDLYFCHVFVLESKVAILPFLDVGKCGA